MGISLHASGFTAPPRPRVILADDHLIVAEGIARLLAEAFDVVGTVEDGDALLEAAQALPADVIVADVVMPRRSGLRVLKELRARGSRIPFVFLSMHSEPAVVAAAMRAGANGYVLKAKAGHELIAALGTVMSGSPYVTPSLAVLHLGAAHETARLTQRQHAIVRLVAKGMPTKQIADALEMSVRTVEAHRYAMMQTFHVHSAVALVQRASELGLLTIDDVAVVDP